MRHYLFLLLLFVSFNAFAQPANDECSNAIEIVDPRSYCSGTYSNLNATNSYSNRHKDVWFKFRARGFEVSITVKGLTLQQPEVGMDENCSGSGMVGSIIRDGNSTIFTKGGLTPNTEYYIWVGGDNAGTFEICTKNYYPPVKPGQDFSGASLLCSVSDTVNAINVTGAGTNNREGAGTCLGTESNSVWYKWVAENNGPLVFTITPTKFDDIDWALYDLGPESNPQTPSAANVIRCAAGHGINNSSCPNEPLYSKTGLDFNETDLTESAGCGQGQNGYVKYIDMVQGHVYALLIDNFSTGNNGFQLVFKDKSSKSGNGQFVGPEAKIAFTVKNPCTINQNYTFETSPINATSLQWYFGAGANIDSANTAGPFSITYSTYGEKTVYLVAKSSRGCTVVDSKTFYVGLTPNPPVLSINKPKFCLNDIIVLTADSIAGGSYLWTGPNNFNSTSRVISIPADNYNRAGDYTATVTVNGCTSNPSTITVPAIGQTPVTDFSMTENQPCTKQQSFTFTNKTTDYQKLRWFFGNGASIPSATTDGPFTITYSSPGDKTIILEAEGSSGCIVKKTITLNVSPVPDIPVVASDKHNYCLTDTIRLTSPYLANTIYSWSGPNNFTASTNDVSIVVNSRNLAGTYSLRITQGKCTSEAATIDIPTIRTNPIAAFKTEPKIPAKLSLPVTVRFFNESTNADTYLWDFGDGNTSTDANPTHEYTETGDYNVTLTAFLSDVCFGSVTKGKFVIRSESSMFIPNTFTPNGDNINDEFVINLTNLNSYQISIFNRYGTKLFATDNIFVNWNGTYQNEPVPVGTYFYIITAKDINNNEIKRSGSVTVIR